MQDMKELLLVAVTSCRFNGYKNWEATYYLSYGHPQFLPHCQVYLLQHVDEISLASWTEFQNLPGTLKGTPKSLWDPERNTEISLASSTELFLGSWTEIIPGSSEELGYYPGILIKTLKISLGSWTEFINLSGIQNRTLNLSMILTRARKCLWDPLILWSWIVFLPNIRLTLSGTSVLAKLPLQQLLLFPWGEKCGPLPSWLEIVCAVMCVGGCMHTCHFILGVRFYLAEHSAFTLFRSPIRLFLHL